MSKIDIMNRTFFLALSYAALAAIIVSDSYGQNSSPAATRTAIFAGGCFWCIQPAFDKAKGIIKTVVVILAEQNQTPRTSSSPPKKLPIENPSKSHTTRRKSPTISCSIFIGGKLIPRKPTASSPTSARVIALPFFMATQRRRKQPMHQRRNWRTPANSISKSSLKFYQQ